MKKTLTLLGLWIALGIASQAVAQNVGVPAPVPTKEKKERPPYYEKQPEMYAAIQSLKEALTHLKKAGGGKGGYKVKAMRKIKDAIRDVRKGVAFDNKNLTPDEKKKMEADFKAEEKEIEAMIAE